MRSEVPGPSRRSGAGADARQRGASKSSGPSFPPSSSRSSRCRPSGRSSGPPRSPKGRWRSRSSGTSGGGSSATPSRSRHRQRNGRRRPGAPWSCRCRTADVLHSFWVPQFAAKRDVFPQKYTTLWFTADSLGAFSGQCAEFCGIQHARMGSLVVVKPAAEFDAWVATPASRARRSSTRVSSRSIPRRRPIPRRRRPSPSVTVSSPGASALFMAGGCIGCHAMVGTPTAGLTALGAQPEPRRQPAHAGGGDPGQHAGESGALAPGTQVGQGGVADEAAAAAHRRGNHRAGRVPPRASVDRSETLMATSVLDHAHGAPRSRRRGCGAGSRPSTTSGSAFCTARPRSSSS